MAEYVAHCAVYRPTDMTDDYTVGTRCVRVMYCHCRRGVIFRVPNLQSDAFCAVGCQTFLKLRLLSTSVLSTILMTTMSTVHTPQSTDLRTIIIIIIIHKSMTVCHFYVK